MNDVEPPKPKKKKVAKAKKSAKASISDIVKQEKKETVRINGGTEGDD